VNKAAVAAYGYSRDEFLRLTVRDIRPAEDVPLFMKIFESRRSGDIRFAEGRHRLKSGAIIDVHVSSHDIEFGDRKAVLVAAIDVSARKAAEAMLRQSQKMDAIGQLTGGVAHDFNNRLAAILGNLELLEGRLRGDPDNHQLVSSALRSTLRGAELTRHLLAFSRMQPLQPETVNISGLLAQTHELLRRTLPESIAIGIDAAEGLWKATVDPAQLESAVLNLALNARDAMPDGGKLRIEVSNVSLGPDAADGGAARSGPFVRLAVTDTGHGMAVETLDRALEPFFTTKELGKGTGLGLSMVYGFVKQSGGHLKISSEIGHGTAVEMFLPKAPDDRTAIEPSLPEQPSAGGGEPILLVDDDAEVRQAVEKMLRDLGYIVHAAEDGRSGLSVLGEHPDIRLMITDVGLPGGMRGPDLVQRAREARPDLRFLYMSGYTKPAAEHGGTFGDGVELMTKPFRKATFSKKVREILNRTG
jgi:PAS domain S-box-containing protein